MLLDLSTAFDTIDHNILSNRLEMMLALEEVHWHGSNHTDSVNEEVSYQSQVQYGVPQGSVLSP